MSSKKSAVRRGSDPLVQARPSKASKSKSVRRIARSNFIGGSRSAKKLNKDFLFSFASAKITTVE